MPADLTTQASALQHIMHIDTVYNYFTLWKATIFRTKQTTHSYAFKEGTAEVFYLLLFFFLYSNTARTFIWTSIISSRA